MSGLSKTNSSSYLSQNRATLLRGGKAYFDCLLQLIENAHETIHLQSYIYDSDETGNIVAVALKKAIKRNVAVYVLVDGYASQVMSQQFIDELRAAGIQFQFFEPFFKSKYFYFGRRMHHKMVVVDTRFALVGGVNIANHYNDILGVPAWLDFAIYIEGEVAKNLCVLCWKSWKSFPSKMGLTPCEEKEINFNFKQENSCMLRMRRNDWVSGKNEISASYKEMFRNAYSHITIMCSYFLPGKSIRSLLKNASKRGVKIVVIIAGKSDLKITKSAERWLYDWLLRYKIILYEYQPTVLHAKMATCDDTWVTIGSYNVNNISAYASIELNIDVRDTTFTRAADTILASIIKNDCKLITLENHLRSKNMMNQFFRWCAYKIISIVFFLLTFYYQQKRSTLKN
jgi:cardiolipin synthase A/B